MLNLFRSGSLRLGFAVGMAVLCLYGVSLLAGCSDSGGTPTQTTLSGSVTGTYTIQQTVPDVGATYMLMGMGTVAPLGQVQAAGSIQTPGNIATGTATGQLTLSTSSGTTTLALTGSQQAGFSPPPGTFQYTITGTTGANPLITNSGNIALNLVSSATTGSGTFTIDFGLLQGRGAIRVHSGSMMHQTGPLPRGRGSNWR